MIYICRSFPADLWRGDSILKFSLGITNKKVWTVNGYLGQLKAISLVLTLVEKIKVNCVYTFKFMPYCTYSETARILGYPCPSTLYKVKKDGWLKHYEVCIDDR